MHKGLALSFAAAVAAGFFLLGAGCDSGPKGTGQDAIQAMPTDQKSAYEERMKAMKGGPMAPGGGPAGPGAGAPPGPPR